MPGLTGQESHERREEITRHPPDILLTNYVMLELLLTRPFERALVNAARGLKFLVLDELHTYRGRQGADVALLVRRVREACQAHEMLCVGTSATMASGGTHDEQRAEIAGVATRLFGAEVKPDDVIGETLTRATEEKDFQDSAAKGLLGKQIADAAVIPTKYDEFVAAPMASWLESTFGLQRTSDSDRLVRAIPEPVTSDHGDLDAASVNWFTSSVEQGCEYPRQESNLVNQHCSSDWIRWWIVVETSIDGCPRYSATFPLEVA